MGNEIRIKDLNGFLRTAAEQANEGKDKKLTTEKEISAFMGYADKLVNAGLVQENYKETLGLTITQAATETVVEEAEASAPDAKTRKEARTERKDQKVYTNKVKKFVKDAVGEAIRVDEFNKRETASIDNIVDALKVKYTQPYYEQAIQDVKEVVSLIRKTEFDSKKDVNDIKKEIKKELNDFQKDIVDDLVELAKEEQIQKETKELQAIYSAKRKAKEGDVENFSQFVKDVKKEMKQKELKGSYYDEALDRVKATAENESAQLQDNKRVDMVENKSENVKAKQVKKELLEGAEKGDKISKQAIRKDKAGNKLTARKLDIDRTAEDLEHITKEELKKALGEDLLNKLGESYLDLREETYNVKDLSDAIASAVGYDFWENRQDSNLEERRQIKTALLKTTKLDDLSDKEINKIMDLCHVKREPKDRNFTRALLRSLTLGIVGGGAGAGLGGSSIENYAVASVTLKGDDIDKILSNAKINGNGGIIKNSDGSVTIRATALQSIEGCGALLGALAGAGIGVAAGTIMALIVGMNNDEGQCFDTATRNIKDIEEYEKHINIDQKDNPEKAKLIIDLARLYKEAYGDDWSEKYHDDLEKFAGNEVLNCLEFRGGRLFAAKPEKAEAPKEDVKAYVAEKPAVEADGYEKPVMEEVGTFDASYSSWELITEMYPCLKDKYPNPNDRIRILKLAQAINNGDYSAKNLDEFLNLSKIKNAEVRRAEMEKKGGIDYDAYVSVLKAGTIGEIKDLKELAGCKKCKDRPDRAKNVTPGGTGVGRYAPDLVQVGTEWVQTRAAQDAVYALKIDGKLKTYKSRKERDDAFADYVNNNKAKNVEKIEISYDEITK